MTEFQRKQFADLLSNALLILAFLVNNRNTKRRCEICSKLTIKIPERRQRLGKCFSKAALRAGDLHKK